MIGYSHGTVICPSVTLCIVVHRVGVGLKSFTVIFLAGEFLYPLLFILLLDQVLKQATTKVAGGDHSDTLAYADDVGLIACSASELQDSINKWCSALKDNGLKLNEAKSEVMVVSRVPETVRIIANGWELNQVEEFKYLGVVYDSTAIKETAVNDRINKYSMNVGMLYPLLKDRHVPRAVKVLIYTSRPIWMRGLDTDFGSQKQGSGSRNASSATHQRRHKER